MNIIILIILCHVFNTTVLAHDTTQNTINGNGQCDTDSCEEVETPSELRRLANKYQSGLLTDYELHHELFNLMDKKETPGAYYSVGYESGAEPGIVIGKQNIYRFSGRFKIPLTMPGKKAHVIVDELFRRPLLIVDLSGDKADDVPDLPLGLTSAYRSGGIDKQLALFRHPGSSITCKEILKDRTLREFERWENAALIIPANLFCPEVLTAKFALAKGRLYKKEIDIGGLSKVTRVFRKEGQVF